ncbi:PREDICTED: calpain-14-like [Gekko japonicus]|uniref:Calpain-14-like n=1 Tax=Gekko japonicus TaxID=146911 RepID=A0ABM1K694_GEKJA|nr:PREDICTED: calpain-14-like [Gekko japonicus]
MPFWEWVARRVKKQPRSLCRRRMFQKSSSLRQQDYQTLLEECLKNKCLFEDENFPADMRSIGTGSLLQKLPQKLQWKRPHELHETPVFYDANTKRLALCQGLIGDCWFLAALEALTFHQDILSQVVPQNQNFERKRYAGIFHFKFWHFGKWVDVVVDDRLPVNEAGQLVFLSSVYKNLFWGALLEKAYAKLCGSYEDLQIGQVSEALVDFTGGVNITIKLAEAPPDLWDILTRATYSRSLIGCQTHLGKTRVLENGLVAGHAYTMTGIRKVTCKHGPEYLVRLKNPWGKVEWKGDWSDGSWKWELLSPKEKILLRRNDDDGEFWMSLQDFKTHFDNLIICKLTPDLMSQEDGKKWMSSLQFGRWVKGVTAGGRLRTQKDTFWMNPQYQLNVLQGNGSKRSLYSCSVLVSLIQKHNSKHRNQMPHLHIGFYVFKGHTAASVSHSPVVLTSLYELERDEMGGNSSLVLSKEIVDKYDGKIWEDFFMKYFEQHPEINAIQLHWLLNTAWTNLQNNRLWFSLDACRSILAVLDFNATGTLSIQEFRSLWKSLLHYQKVFQKKDTHQTGTLGLEELHAATKEMGTSLSDEVCNLMVLRYGDRDLKISFQSFVCFMLRVEFLKKAFFNLTKDGKGIYLQEYEWMMMTLYS